MIILVGRPNVGKSTLFNRLIGKRQAIASSVAGTTINAKEGKVLWQGKEIPLFDLAGFPLPKNAPLHQEITERINSFFNQADAILFVVDSRMGLTQEDLEIINTLRKISKPTIIAVNKVDGEMPPNMEIPKDFKEVFYLSALHGKGISELLDKLSKYATDPKGSKPRFKLALIGRQNVGKSTLFNRILKDNRSIISDIPGTTRDPVEAQYHDKKISLVLIDTAGVRKRGKISGETEKLSVQMTNNSIFSSQAVICVLDAAEGPTRQDIHLIDLAKRHKKDILIVVNKWDLMKTENNDPDKLEEMVRALLIGRFPFVRNFKIIPISAMTGWNCEKVTSWIQGLHS